ncbi:FAD-binding oxidoreductase [Nisaea acidiphila]|uniref:FAD-binding oxidoreductase n=1 Tax=Nisaea acidiphila TaxID=1862145 RepID=A0A9J7AZD5_9PROT|nr:FAD-binding oxidoreductase [Nisaea acidiphila]UUX52138.1 FAD-binding oxidoreductase [Nisaea acidiphila]
MAEKLASDVVIVGGGVIGSAIAYFLATAPGGPDSITVIERDSTYETASTPRSAGGIRQQFSNPENIEIGLFGHHFVTHLADYLSVEGDCPDPGFVEGGYLFLAGPSGLDVLKQNHADQSRLGAEIALLDKVATSERFPWLHLDGIAGAAYGLCGEGWLDPNTLMQAFRRKARSLGVTYIEAEVTGFETDGKRLDAVLLADGRRISAGTVVNAAGPNAGRVAAMAGILLPVVPRKRNVFVFDCREPLDPAVPLLIDPSGVYVRPESGGYICGVSPPSDRDPDGETSDLEVDYHWFEEVIWPTLAHRVPAFEAIKLTGAWAGHYDYNTIDQNGIVGNHPEIANFYFANGFSGHGLQQAPAVGRALAELITSGAFRTIDLSRFCFERFETDALVLERNIV